MNEFQVIISVHEGDVYTQRQANLSHCAHNCKSRCYLYTLLLIVLSPPKSSELTAHIVQLVCTKSKIQPYGPGYLDKLNSLYGRYRALAWATCKPCAKEWQGERQGQSD